MENKYDKIMEKIKVRCIEEYVDLFPNHYNIKIYIVINGGWSFFSTYQCVNCSEVLVSKKPKDLEKMIFENIVKCPNCNSIINGNIIKYPEKIAVNKKIILSNLNLGYIKNIESSDIKEFYLLPEPNNVDNVQD